MDITIQERSNSSISSQFGEFLTAQLSRTFLSQKQFHFSLDAFSLEKKLRVLLVSPRISSLSTSTAHEQSKSFLIPILNSKEDGGAIKASCPYYWTCQHLMHTSLASISNLRHLLRPSQVGGRRRRDSPVTKECTQLAAQCAACPYIKT